jgi:hypothetical protein
MQTLKLRMLQCESWFNLLALWLFKKVTKFSKPPCRENENMMASLQSWSPINTLWYNSLLLTVSAGLWQLKKAVLWIQKSGITRPSRFCFSAFESHKLPSKKSVERPRGEVRSWEHIGRMTLSFQCPRGAQGTPGLTTYDCTHERDPKQTH